MIEPAFRKILAEDTAVAAIADDRVWLGQRPQDERRPGVVITLTDTDRAHTFDGPGGYVDGVMKLDALAPDYRTAKELMAAMIAVLDGFSGVVGDVSIDFIECDSESDIESVPVQGRALATFGVSVDASFQYQTQP